MSKITIDEAITIMDGIYRSYADTPHSKYRKAFQMAIDALKEKRDRDGK